MSYQAAGEYDSQARLLMEKLHQPEKAMDIVRQHGGQSSAARLAAHFRAQGAWAEAVEFGLLAGEDDAAYEEALVHGQMDVYVEKMQGEGRPRAHKAL